MKRVALLLAFAGMVSINVLAQAPDGAVQRALLAAPVRMRDAATVVKWKPDFTYDTLQKGTNRLVCYDRSGFPEQRPFSIECTSIANLPRVAQNLKFEAAGDRAKTQALLDAAEKDGTRVKPEYGSVWYHLAGADEQSAHPHTTIAVPGATAASTGLPETTKEGGVWVMNPGTTSAHLMIPGQ